MFSFVFQSLNIFPSGLQISIRLVTETFKKQDVNDQESIINIFFCKRVTLFRKKAVEKIEVEIHPKVDVYRFPHIKNNQETKIHKDPNLLEFF